MIEHHDDDVDHRVEFAFQTKSVEELLVGDQPFAKVLLNRIGVVLLDH